MSDGMTNNDTLGVADDPGRRWLSAGELAEIFGCSVWTIRRAVAAGRYRVAAVSDRVIRIDRLSVPGLRRSRERSELPGRAGGFTTPR